MKRAVLTVIILTIVTALTCAASALGTVENVRISERGIITWDEYPGTEKYWIGIDGGYLPVDRCEYDLSSDITEAGEHSVEIGAYKDDSQVQLAQSHILTVVFDGSKFALSAAQTEDTAETADSDAAPSTGSEAASPSDSKASSAADGGKTTSEDGSTAPSGKSKNGTAVAALVVSCVSLAASCAAVIVSLKKK